MNRLTAAFDVHPSRLAFYDETMRFVTEPGTFRFSVGGASDNVPTEVVGDLTGEVTEYHQREIVAASITADWR